MMSLCFLQAVLSSERMVSVKTKKPPLARRIVVVVARICAGLWLSSGIYIGASRLNGVGQGIFVKEALVTIFGLATILLTALILLMYLFSWVAGKYVSGKENADFSVIPTSNNRSDRSKKISHKDIDVLEKLWQLHQDGALSTDEFKAQKTKLLK